MNKFLISAVLVLSGLNATVFAGTSTGTSNRHNRNCNKNKAQTSLPVKTKAEEKKVHSKPEVMESGLIDRSEFIDGTTICELYQMMKDIHDVLVTNGIEYWAIAGTMLGAVRHGGIIPWDNDLDICIRKSQQTSFVKLNPFLNSIGYRIVYCGELLYKIFPIGKDYPFIDIFLFIERGDGIFYGWYNFFRYPRENRNIVIYKKELFPMKDYKFGDIFIKGPNDPQKYLACCYGNNYMSVAYYGKNHLKEAPVKWIRLQDEDKIPAQPTGPLNENVFKKLSNLPYLIETGHLSTDRLDDVCLFLSKDKIKSLISGQYYLTNFKNTDSSMVGSIVFSYSTTKSWLDSLVKSEIIKSYTLASSTGFDGDAQSNDVCIIGLDVASQHPKQQVCKELILSVLFQHQNAQNVSLLLSAESQADTEYQDLLKSLKFEQIGEFRTIENDFGIIYSTTSESLKVFKIW